MSIPVAIVGVTITGIIENGICLFTTETTITTPDAIAAEAIATPSNPKRIMPSGVKIHVATVQPIIKNNVTFIFPIALSALVKGVETEEKHALMPKKKRDANAGSHF